MSTERRAESNNTRTESNNSSKEAESSQEETGNQQNTLQPSEVEKKLQDEKDKLEIQLKDITVSLNGDIQAGPVRFNPRPPDVFFITRPSEGGGGCCNSLPGFSIQNA